MLLYDGDMVDWNAFDRFREALASIPRPQNIDLSYVFDQNLPINILGALEDILESVPIKKYGPMVEKREALSLENLLNATEDCVCQNREDKIYGLLAIASDVSTGDISVNYSQSLFDLYQDVIRFHVEKGFSGKDLVSFSVLLQRSLLGPGFDISSMVLAGRSRMLQKPMKVSAVCTGKITTGFSSIEQAYLSYAGYQYRVGYFDVFRWIEVLDHLMHVDYGAYILLSQDTTSTPRGIDLFVCEDGQIGFASNGIQNGDILCWFEDNNMAAIIREKGGDPKAIGRAVVAKYRLKSKLDSAGMHLEWPRPVFDGGEPFILHGSQIELSVDISTLQVLTCPLEWKCDGAPSFPLHKELNTVRIDSSAVLLRELDQRKLGSV
jgi:hypothetical protein